MKWLDALWRSGSGCGVRLCQNCCGSSPAAAGIRTVSTTTGPSRLAELCDLVDHPRILRCGDPSADFSVLDDLDGLLIAMAPTTATYEEDQYRAVYGEAVPALVNALRERPRTSPLHVSYLSSAGIYGDQSGAITTELSSPDLSNTTNALLVQAETAVLGLNNPLIQPVCCALGHLRPGKDILLHSMPRGSHTQERQPSMPGCTWMTLFVGWTLPCSKTAGHLQPGGRPATHPT